MTFNNWVTIVIALCAGGIIFWLIRRQRLSVYHTLVWMLVVVGVVLLGIFPSVIDWLGHMLGINYPPVLLLVVALCIVLVKLLTMDIERTGHETRLRILTQRMAAYEAELHRLKKENKSDL